VRVLHAWGLGVVLGCLARRVMSGDQVVTPLNGFQFEVSFIEFQNQISPSFELAGFSWYGVYSKIKYNFSISNFTMFWVFQRGLHAK
jgi:hypothetical protein